MVSLWHTTRLRGMNARGGPHSGYPGYAATKAGIIGLSQQIAVDYASAGIRVNVVSPGPVVSDLAATSAMHEGIEFPALGPAGAPNIEAVAPGTDPAPAELHPAHTPSPRLFKPSTCTDVAYPILWLVSDEAAAITGINLTVDGGFTMKGIASLAPDADPAMAAQMNEPL
jgi:NAD(P)-dependent dehydrogenase (short-subunit alcohol dehydrogenase family)